jgi:hypothetical protein
MVRRDRDYIYARETVGLSQTQEHTVLKDAEMLPLVPAARRG